jgi:putative sterol carrier protein
MGSLRGAIGTPEQVAELMDRYERAGVDEVVFASQAGNNKHEHICESIELFARDVLPRFEARRAQQEAAKAVRLAPAIQRALARRPPARQAPAEYTIWPAHEAWHHATPDGHRADVPRQIGQAAFQWFVKSRSDAQLDWMFGSLAGQSLIFNGMRRAYQGQPAKAVSGTIQYHLSARSGNRGWVVRIADGALQAQPGVDPRAATTVRTDAATFARIAAGQQTAATAAMAGRLKIDGDLRLVARLGEALRQTPT